MNVLVLNCGSSSVKYQVVDVIDDSTLRSGKIERIGGEKSHAQALAEILELVRDLPIAAVGHRVVHGGARFSDATLIDDVVEQQIADCVPLAPLHNPANLEGIRAARRALPDAPQVAVFDTAFHSHLPRRARSYAIDGEIAERLGIRRYGFHGTSHAFIAGEAARFLGRPMEELRLITCHLGSGASVAAVEFGHSVETSMGMTPLEGLVMGTRSGDLDPGVILRLLDEGWTREAIETLLQRESGLKGLSGVSNDLRDIEERAAAGDDRARLAIAVFAHRVRKYIGAYAATMGGADAVVFCGGIGENSAAMRHRIIQRFEFLGLLLDEDRNTEARVDPRSRVAEVSTVNARVKALVVATDEELAIARETAHLLRESRDEEPEPIPIAVSARHVHLTAEVFQQLFGAGAELTHFRDLSQPGQFAAVERVNLIGPRRRIDDVRILGPFRSTCQVEISRTDEFHLGVDAPVRASGKTQGSAPITLEGPQGTVHLNEGLICALRHIHMAPEDAETYGVGDGDNVEVAIDGGPRDLVFGDVLVRVSPKYRLEMHIDTDEANAAELSQSAEGALVALPATATICRRSPRRGPTRLAK